MCLLSYFSYMETTTNADHDVTHEHKLTKKTQLING